MTPISLSDYERVFEAALVDPELDRDARAAYLAHLSDTVRAIPWRVAGGKELAQRIADAVDRDVDLLRGQHSLIVLGRLVPPRPRRRTRRTVGSCAPRSSRGQCSGGRARSRASARR